MKVYGGCYDGVNRVVVAAKSMKAAYEALEKTSARVGSFNHYRKMTSITGNPRELHFALGELGQVFTSRNDYRGDFVKAAIKDTKGE